MTAKILVTYATRAGSTTEVAAAIGEAVAVDGAAVDVLPVSEVESLVDYEAVVIGSPIHGGKWLMAALDFVDDHRDALLQLPVAIFATCLRLRDDTEEMRQSVAGTVEGVRVLLQPVSMGLFAGAMDYGKLSAIMRLQVQTKGLPEGDWRDWETIRAWGAALRKAF